MRMMNLLYLGLIATATQAQIVLSTDTLFVQDAELPNGYYSLRIYVSSAEPTDVVNAVVGSAEYPLSISVHGGDVWNHLVFGGAHSGQLNCNLQVIDPSQRYDSFVTIGDTCGSSANTVNVVEDPAANAWLNPFFQPADSSSNEVNINTAVGGGWFVTATSDANTMGSDLRVLLAQITTNGTVCGILNVQVEDSAGVNTLHTGLTFGPAACTGVCNLSADFILQQPQCAGETGSITAIPLGGFAPYQFLLNDLYQPTLVAQNLVSGEYVLELADAFGCGFADAIAIDALIPLSIQGLMAIAIDSTSGGNTEYEVSGGTPPYSFQWTGPNGFVTSSPNLPALTDAAMAGEYQLLVTDSNGCSIAETLLITDNKELNRLPIRIYPNPSTGMFIIEQNGPLSISVRDMLGRNIAFTQATLGAGMHQVHLQAGAGHYIISDNNSAVKYGVVIN